MLILINTESGTYQMKNLAKKSFSKAFFVASMLLAVILINLLKLKLYQIIWFLFAFTPMALVMVFYSQFLIIIWFCSQFLTLFIWSYRLEYLFTVVRFCSISMPRNIEYSLALKVVFFSQLLVAVFFRREVLSFVIVIFVLLPKINNQPTFSNLTRFESLCTLGEISNNGRKPWFSFWITVETPNKGLNKYERGSE